MKVIDAFWEQRNLGVQTKEIVIEENDRLELVKNELRNIEAEYMVVKIPAGKMDFMFFAENLGYHYIESIIHVTKKLDNIELPSLYSRVNQQVEYGLMNEEEKEELFIEIKKGLFYTDRISLDDFFSEEQASNRYIGWISDELERGSQLFKLTYKNEIVGFFALKELENHVFYPFLAGIYPQYQNGPLGTVFNYKTLIEAKRQNGKKISTYISTNNSNVIRMHVLYNYQFENIQYVYIKHKHL